MTGAAQLPDGALAAAGLAQGAEAGRATLDMALLAAHAADDRAALVGLYAEAAGRTRGTAAAFYLTHAYIFALEAGDPRARMLKRRLIEIGADQPDAP